ncbi:uncharacterized protein LOC113378431 [Ctenocephalides felis]|uniref:uncharacterized protein LOC113378431 n=1 Tax=Ctenocephalides felis TaxID=7515 RepID=UPI000E6E39DC|nr:uncharacterized protein LOC113378431 [Ctenocephalides felis]
MGNNESLNAEGEIVPVAEEIQQSAGSSRATRTLFVGTPLEGVSRRLHSHYWREEPNIEEGAKSTEKDPSSNDRQEPIIIEDPVTSGQISRKTKENRAMEIAEKRPRPSGRISRKTEENRAMEIAEKRSGPSGRISRKTEENRAMEIAEKRSTPSGRISRKTEENRAMEIAEKRSTPRRLFRESMGGPEEEIMWGISESERLSSSLTNLNESQDVNIMEHPVTRISESEQLSSSLTNSNESQDTIIIEHPVTSFRTTDYKSLIVTFDKETLYGKKDQSSGDSLDTIIIEHPVTREKDPSSGESQETLIIEHPVTRLSSQSRTREDTSQNLISMDDGLVLEIDNRPADDIDKDEKHLPPEELFGTIMVFCSGNYRAVRKVWLGEYVPYYYENNKNPGGYVHRRKEINFHARGKKLEDKAHFKYSS